jgi:hypothetical protein
VFKMTCLASKGAVVKFELKTASTGSLAPPAPGKAGICLVDSRLYTLGTTLLLLGFTTRDTASLQAYFWAIGGPCPSGHVMVASTPSIAQRERQGGCQTPLEA